MNAIATIEESVREARRLARELGVPLLTRRAARREAFRRWGLPVTHPFLAAAGECVFASRVSVYIDDFCDGAARAVAVDLRRKQHG